MRFLADMGVSSRTVAWLRGLGHDAVHVREYAMQRATDAEILSGTTTGQTQSRGGSRRGR